MRKLGDSPGIECWLLRQDAPHRHAGFYRIANCDAISMVRMTAMIRLLPYDPSYLASFVEWRAQQLSVRHNPLQPMNEQDIAQMLESEGSDLSDLKKYEKYRWFVECGGVAVGSVALKNISHTMGYAEIGYGIGEAHQRQGIATAAVTLLIRMCFCDSPLRKLLAYVHDKNVASCRVLQKLGFTQEGLLREHYIINGSPENEILFGLLKQEWKQ